MGLFDSSRVLIGIALLVVGTVLFVPAAVPTASTVFVYALAPAALILALGTWLVGTSEGSPTV